MGWSEKLIHLAWAKNTSRALDYWLQKAKDQADIRPTVTLMPKISAELGSN
jgi:hypothetical protein